MSRLQKEEGKKRRFSTEMAYLCGILLIASGVVLMEKADFGMSMVVAPAYLLYRWLAGSVFFFTFGMAEYALQALLLLVMMLILRRFRLSYLFSFATAVFYGLVLDALMVLGRGLPADLFWQRLLCYLFGMVLCAAGVSAMFHTYIPPEAYELFVKELSAHFGVELHRFKTGYDCASCILSVLMSFLIFGFGHFEGVKAGTVLCALVNGWLIGRFSALYEKQFCFYDRFRFRRFFDQERTGPPLV